MPERTGTQGPRAVDHDALPGNKAHRVYAAVLDHVGMFGICNVVLHIQRPVNPGGIAGRRLPDAPFTFRTRIDTRTWPVGGKFRFMSSGSGDHRL